MSETPDSPARDPLGRFGPGNPGRPLGSRNRMSAAVRDRLLRHIEGNMDRVLDRYAKDYFTGYAKLVLRLAGEDPVDDKRPKDAEDYLDGEPPHLWELSEEDACRFRDQALAALNHPCDVRQQLARLEVVLDGGDYDG